MKSIESATRRRIVIVDLHSLLPRHAVESDITRVLANVQRSVVASGADHLIVSSPMRLLALTSFAANTMFGRYVRVVGCNRLNRPINRLPLELDRRVGSRFAESIVVSDDPMLTTAVRDALSPSPTRRIGLSTSAATDRKGALATDQQVVSIERSAA